MKSIDFKIMISLIIIDSALAACSIVGILHFVVYAILTLLLGFIGLVYSIWDLEKSKTKKLMRQ